MPQSIENLPYCKVVPATRNPAAVRALHACYCGRYGALPSMLQFFTDAQQCRKLGDLSMAAHFSALAQQRFIHLDLFAQLLLAYGGGAQLHTHMRGMHQPWNTGNLQALASPAQIGTMAKRAHHATVAQYRQALAAIPEPENQAVIERMLSDVLQEMG